MGTSRGGYPDINLLAKGSVQEWRDNGMISYIQISGKILYRQSDILKLLEDNYEKSWREE